MISNLLFDCDDCEEKIKYSVGTLHNLRHHSCKFCLKEYRFSTWDELRSHYYLECVKSLVKCESCVYQSPRQFYAGHECKHERFMHSFWCLLLLVSLILLVVRRGLRYEYARDMCSSFEEFATIPYSIFLLFTHYIALQRI